MGNGILDYNSKGVLWGSADFAKGSELFTGIMFKKKEGIKSEGAFVSPLVFDFKKEGRLSNNIHSLFCPEFDAIFLNEDKCVVDVMVRVKPWRFMIVPREAFRFLIEVPAGQALQNRIHLGQRLEFYCPDEEDERVEFLESAMVGDV